MTIKTIAQSVSYLLYLSFWRKYWSFSCTRNHQSSQTTVNMVLENGARLILCCSRIWNHYTEMLTGIPLWFYLLRFFQRIRHCSFWYPTTKLSIFCLDDGFLKLFLSYLQNRVQRVKVRNSVSSAKRNSSGVPEGSILGPQLFLNLIPINQNTLSLKSSSSLMTPNSEVLFRVFSILNADIGHSTDWSDTNKLSINLLKCQYFVQALFQKQHNCLWYQNRTFFTNGRFWSIYLFFYSSFLCQHVKESVIKSCVIELMGLQQ